MLASGGNDNQLLLWSGYNSGSAGFSNTPVHSISEHTAAVKVGPLMHAHGAVPRHCLWCKLVPMRAPLSDHAGQ